MMTPDQLRRSYIDFMKKRGASQVPSASLLPENDPSTLFTGSGMQPMVPYLLGEKHPVGNEITDIQKCLRTVDIDEVGDRSHLTFFEMLGRWEFSANEKDYKNKQIDAIWDWQIHELGIDPDRLYVSAFKGCEALDIEGDSETVRLWSEKFRSVGIEPVVEAEPYKYGASRGAGSFCTVRMRTGGADREARSICRSGNPADRTARCSMISIRPGMSLITPPLTVSGFWRSETMCSCVTKKRRQVLCG